MNRLGRELSEAEQKDPENSVEYWRNQIQVHGAADVTKRLEAPSLIHEVWQYFAEEAVDEHEKSQLEQHSRREAARDRREEATLKIAKEANVIAKKARQEMRYTWTAALLIAIVTIAITIALA